jgi:cellulose synthase (UDP-forming)
VLSEDFISSLSWPFYILLLLSLVSVAFGVVRLFAEPQNVGAIRFVMFWAILDAIMLLAVLGITFERRQVRSEPRLRCEEPIQAQIAGQVFKGFTSNASSSGLALSLQQAPNDALPNFADSTPVKIILLARNDAQLHGRLRSCRRIPNAAFSIGISYSHQNDTQERLSIDLAFGNSETLVQNNQRRHAGRSVIGALLALIRYALTNGVGHLVFLIKQQSKRLLDRLCTSTSR